MKTVFVVAVCCVGLLSITLDADAQRRRGAAIGVLAELIEVLDYSGLLNATSELDQAANAEKAAYDEMALKATALAAAQTEFDVAEAGWETAKATTDAAYTTTGDELGQLRP